jgi:outer membrane receptor protein involved in Fe transport
LGGVFYAKEKLNTADRLLYGSAFESYVSLTASASIPAVPSATQLSTWAGLPFGTLYRSGTGLQDAYQQTSESYAIFTNNSIEITDGLELTLGVRYTSETKDLTSYHWNPGGTGSAACSGLLTRLAQDMATLPDGDLFPLGARTAALGFGCGTWADPAFDAVTLQQSLDESEVSGTAKIAYRFSDAVMAYGSYARGYKASGFNLDRERLTFGQIDRNTSFPAETVDSYELGAKTTLIENSLFLNAAVFYQVYDNFQLNTF